MLGEGAYYLSSADLAYSSVMEHLCLSHDTEHLMKSVENTPYILVPVNLGNKQGWG